jgi:uncharacterized membrane protein
LLFRLYQDVPELLVPIFWFEEDYTAPSVVLDEISDLLELQAKAYFYNYIVLTFGICFLTVMMIFKFLLRHTTEEHVIVLDTLHQEKREERKDEEEGKALMT